MAVDLPDLLGQHRMRDPAEAAGISGRGVDLNDLEGVTEPVLSVLNRSAGAIGSPENLSASAHSPSSEARFSITLISLSGESGIASGRRGQRDRDRGLAEHRSQHAVVHRDGQRETTGETLSDHSPHPCPASRR